MTLLRDELGGRPGHGDEIARHGRRDFYRLGGCLVHVNVDGMGRRPQSLSKARVLLVPRS